VRAGILGVLIVAGCGGIAAGASDSGSPDVEGDVPAALDAASDRSLGSGEAGDTDTSAATGDASMDSGLTDGGNDARLPPVSFDACGLTPSPPQPCGGGGVEKLTQPEGIVGLATDSSSFYWDYVDLLMNTGAVEQCSISSCGCTTLASGSNSDFTGLAVNATAVYWGTKGSVEQCAIGGCGGMPTTTYAGGGLRCGDYVATQLATIYFDTGNQSVVSCPATGCVGAPTTIAAGASDQLAGFVVAGSGVALAFGPTAPQYEYEIDTCAVSNCSTLTKLASSLSPALALAGGNVYFTTLDGAIATCPVTGCGAAGPQTLVSGDFQASPLAVDGSNFYFAAECPTGGPMAIAKCPLSGCSTSPTVLAVGDGYAWSGAPQQFAFDAKSVYWFTASSTMAGRIGAIFRAPK
jgi:hypothetical protein